MMVGGLLVVVVGYHQKGVVGLLVVLGYHQYCVVVVRGLRVVVEVVGDHHWDSGFTSGLQHQ